MRNPTYHRRRTERLRREEARRALATERKLVEGQLEAFRKVAENVAVAAALSRAVQSAASPGSQAH